MTALRVARLMHWTYDEVCDLPAAVFAVLIAELATEQGAAAGASRPVAPDDATWPD